MTGIHLPAGLMPGHTPDPQLVRPALTIDKLAALMPVPEVTQGDVQSSTGETLQARQPNTVGTGPGTGPNGAQTTSTRETLSFAARAILDVMERGDAQPLRANGPLLTAPPTAGAAAATQTLSAALATLVGQSGMFYESHLAQWINGQLPLASLLQEPQSAVRPQVPAQNAPLPGQPAPANPPPVALLPYGGPAAVPAPPNAAVLAELTRPTVFPPNDARLVPGAPAAPAQSGQAGAPGPAQAGHSGQLAQAASQLPPAEQRRAAQATAAAQAYRTTADAAQEGHHVANAQRAAAIASWNAPAPSHTPADTGPPLHPATEGVVRQQLELLATQQFRFAVEAWPGMPVDWEVTRHEGGQQGQASEGTDQWSTRLRLALPQLGNVEAVLTLGARGLEARLVTHDADAATRLTRARADFRAQLDARGIALLNLTVNTADAVEDTLAPAAANVADAGSTAGAST